MLGRSHLSAELRPACTQLYTALRPTLLLQRALTIVEGGHRSKVTPRLMTAYSAALCCDVGEGEGEAGDGGGGVGAMLDAVCAVCMRLLEDGEALTVSRIKAIVLTRRSV